MATHRVSVTVSDPGHTMSHMRTAKVEKRIRVKADSPQDATSRARNYYNKRGFKVHDHNHIGEITEQAEQFEQGVSESLSQALRKFVPGYAKREIDKKMDAQKFGRTDVDKDANYYRYKKIQDKLKKEEASKDPREYDYEGDMAKSQLRAIIANAQQVHDMLEDTTNMAEWVQSKITLAADYISTVADYMQSEVNEESGDKDYPKTLNIEAMDREHPIAKEYQAMKQHDIKTLRNMIKGQQRIVDTSGYTSKDHAISAYLRHKHGDKKVAAAMGLKEEEMDTRIWEAWSLGKRDPQRGIKVGQQVRSYDFPGMHDDHYIEGHVVADNAHTYHIRVNKVVRSGKEIPTPAHLAHVEAPKGKGMFSSAYAVHKIMAKQASVAATAEPTQGAARTFTALRGRK